MYVLIVKCPKLPFSGISCITKKNFNPSSENAMNGLGVLSEELDYWRNVSKYISNLNLFQPLTLVIFKTRSLIQITLLIC